MKGQSCWRYFMGVVSDTTMRQYLGMYMYIHLQNAMTINEK